MRFFLPNYQAPVHLPYPLRITSHGGIFRRVEKGLPYRNLHQVLPGAFVPAEKAWVAILLSCTTLRIAGRGITDLTG